MKEKLTTLGEAVTRIPSGSSIAMGGSILRRQPNAVVHELLRRGVKNITLMAFPSSIAADLLAAAGSLNRFEGIYVGLFWYGLAPNFRRAVQQGQVDVRDFPESVMVARFRAASMGLTYHPVKALLGTDMARLNPEQVREITCPFTGEQYHAVPPAEADFTIIHGYVGDKYGNVQWPVVRDSDDIDQLIARAGKRLIVAVERIVPHGAIIRRPNLTYIPHSWVEAIVETPFGAHPTACDTFYNEDDDHLRAYIAAGRDPEHFQAYLSEYVYGVKDHSEYLQRVGGMEKLARLRVEGEEW